MSAAPTDRWCTPRDWLDRVSDVLGGIAFDPCASSDTSLHFAATNVTAADNGLARGWDDGWYANPPYSRGNLQLWIAKCAEQAGAGRDGLALVPSRTGSRWFQRELWPSAQALLFVAGRIPFVDPNTGEQPGRGRIDTVFAFYGAGVPRFREVFGEHGRFVQLSARSA